ncbi:MAG: hypothetical protein HY308_05275 [Gammaproteobacteria bacterium]|nr:hypothetical protein [Gammaproteobacteria bacterium]
MYSPAHVVAAVVAALIAGCGNSTSGSTAGEAAAGKAKLSATQLDLKWNPNTDTITGYLVYYGRSSDDTPTLLSDISLDSPGFNPKTPSVSYIAERDLSLTTGDFVCFRLKAYARGLESAFSESTCGTII